MNPRFLSKIKVRNMRPNDIEPDWGAVRIDRRTKWGNPFRVGEDGSRAEVIEKYRTWIQTQPDLMAALHEIRGKDLACWCAPLPCHGDVLLELANR